LLTMIVFSIFFGGLAKISSDGYPYPVYTYTALLPWELFATALSIASRSLVGNANMITKIYFPRMILPMSSVLGGLVDFAIAFLVLIALMIGYGISPTPAVWTLPFFILLAVVTALGIGLWLSALNVLYRDIGYIIPFLTQMWLFITPVVYPTSMLPESWRFIYALNPMSGVVDGFRWALLGNQQSAPGPTLIISSVISVLVLISGMFYFRRMERQFADMV
jgi:lipopolysaccharide transport system permease protein